MSTGRAITALVVGFLLSNILTTIYYIVTASMNTVPFQREQQVFIGLFLTHFIFVGIMVYMYPRWSRSVDSAVAQGALFGALMAAMMFIPQAVLVRSIWTVDFNAIFAANIVAHTVIGAIVGIAIALIHSRGSSPATA
ncbi:MAG: hypothetical protein DWQ07_20620 [Chloroflexi bacterium]|nr:MAG: hypothetical protein DWQ07_20620 [Chloroflexota bacterium]MBL1194488.1 hypothetical protein [Chloroflexota bacterium]NOH11776.1 hypothetical protein [Chloroflexota bacterium]